MRTALSILLALLVLAFIPLSIAAPSAAISNASASRPAFNSVSGQETISYSITGATNGSVMAAIVGPGSFIDRTIPGRSDTGRNSITWDGKYGNGSPAREGRYTVWIMFIPAGSTAPAQGQRFNMTGGTANASVAFIVDNTPPSTSVSAAGDYTEAVQASLTATDALSGVNVTEYRLDGGPWSPYGGPVTIGEGPHTLFYRSRDRAGNVEPARSVPVNVTLTADDPGPRVISTFPGGTDVGVPPDSIVSAWFDRDMDGGSINGDTFRLRNEAGDYVDGTVDYGAAAVFIPTGPLEPLTQYTAVIHNVIDAGGNEMIGEYEWTFVTLAILADDNAAWYDDSGEPTDVPDESYIIEDETGIDNTSDGGQLPGDDGSPVIPQMPQEDQGPPAMAPDPNPLPPYTYVAGGSVFMALVAAGYGWLNHKFGKK